MSELCKIAMNEYRPIPEFAPDGEPAETDLFEKQKQEWHRAQLAANLLAINPLGLRGIHLKGPASPAVTRWTDHIASLLNPNKRHIIPHTYDVANFAPKMDFLESLAKGVSVWNEGLLSQLSGSMVLLPQASLMMPALRSAISDALEKNSDFTVIAVDESGKDEDGLSEQLNERLGMVIELNGQSLSTWTTPLDVAANLSDARQLLKSVIPTEKDYEIASGLSIQFGIASLRIPYFALQAARANAALSGHTKIEENDFLVAAMLVLMPRATQVPNREEEQPQEPEPPNEEEQQQDDDEQDQQSNTQENMEIDEIVEAAQALFAHDLAPSKMRQAASRSAQARRTKGGKNKRVKHGKPIGVRRGRRDEIRELSMRDTLLTALSKQSIRRQMPGIKTPATGRRFAITVDDFRVLRRKAPQRVTTIFLVDASGSHAVGRLNEAKGAALSMLQTCYERRDQVAVISFGGREAIVSLAPTSAPARAAKELTLMPSGGGTPLASALMLGMKTALKVRQDGDTPFLVLLTDGKANIALNGAAGRSEAAIDVKALTQAIKLNGLETFFIDTGRRSSDACKTIADDLKARYLHLHRVPPSQLHQELKQAAKGASHAAFP